MDLQSEVEAARGRCTLVVWMAFGLLMALALGAWCLW
jgi:hypothetical protein